HELLKKHSEGLVALSGCMGGEIPQALLSGEKERARELLTTYQDIFGKENFYIEISHHPGIANHEALQQTLRDFAKETNAPVVATQDCHYTRPDDANAQDVLLAVQTNTRLDDDDRLTMRSDDFSFRSSEEMTELFKDLPEAILNTTAIAERANVEIELGVLQLPEYPLPKGETAESYLYKMCFERLSNRYNPAPPEVETRLRYELGVIEKTGFASYFLIVQDFVNWARTQGIVVGPGRGSAAGSIIAYVLGITNVDPIKYNLLFERFMNPERISPPDIDLDFADTRRDEVLAYVSQKYGYDHVAQIITFGTMAARAALRDAGRALGLSYDFCDHLAKLIPFNPNQGQKENYLKECLEGIPELRALYQSTDDARRLIDAAMRLEGVVRHASTHACGVVITKDPLPTIVPLQYASGREDKKESITTQFEMHAIEDLGVLKVDFLGLSNLSIIEETIKRVKKLYDKDIDIENLAVDDPAVFKTLAEGKTVGVFQLEGAGMTRFLKELKPTNIEDIIAMVSLYRPGPMELIPSYILRKHGKEQVAYLHPNLEPILKNTYGIMIYQEQLMQAAQALAGFTLPEADTLRKAVGKKIRSLLEEQKEKLIAGTERAIGSRRLGETFWDLVEPFARYGFNRSHAAGYAMIAYQTAWLKTYYPVEFMAALLNSDSKNIDRISSLVSVCAQEKIVLLPPDINESRNGFTVTDEKAIRFGLAAVKNVGANVVSEIVKERDLNGPFTSLSHFIERIWTRDLNKKSLEALTKSGALDNFGERNKILTNMERILEYSRNTHQAAASDQHSLFGLMEDKSSLPELKLTETQPASTTDRLTWEKELLGLYVSGHPLEQFPKALADATPIKAWKDKGSARKAKLCGMITEAKRILTKRGEPMMFLKLQDKSDEIEGVAFPSTLQLYGHLLQPEACVYVEGKINERNGIPSIVCDKIEALTA
ncbi:MAG: DNA polymerase III subunit alpha, partial [Patescibacteria group bacterium]